MKPLLSLLLLACTALAGESRFIFERGLMGTRFAVICHGSDEALAKAAADAAFQRAEEINAVASDYLAGSELLRLSEKAGQPVKLSPLLFDLLTKSQDFARRTDGRFDPTLGPLTKLWRETRRTGKLPSPESLNVAKAACGWTLLELDPSSQTLTLKSPGMRLDLGGIAKGYAADAMCEVMKSKGFPATCIAAGGDLRLGDPPPGKSGWAVGIKTLEKDKTAGQVELSNCAVSTSGDLQQAVEIEGVRYAHILDPKTGLGLTKHLAVTIIALDATTSDALATAACVAGPEQAAALAKQWGAKEVRIAE
jgi:FAD:protein FMN transferase